MGSKLPQRYERKSWSDFHPPYQIPVFARVRAAVGYLRGLPLVPFEVGANAPGRGLLDVDHCAGLASGAVMQSHIALDASGKQGMSARQRVGARG